MADRMSLVCPGCTSRLSASASFAGRSCRCPRCGHQVVVPELVFTDQPSALIRDDGHRLPSRGRQSDMPVILRYRA
jgi:hypothetical protein